MRRRSARVNRLGVSGHEWRAGVPGDCGCLGKDFGKRHDAAAVAKQGQAVTPEAYTLVGAIGGAVVTAAATVYASLSVHRRQVKQRRAEEARQAQEHEAVRQREVDLRQRERHLRRRMEEIDRLVSMRTMGRAWLDALERATQNLALNRSVRVGSFDSEVRFSSQGLAAAAYAAARDGAWVCTSSAPDPAADDDPGAPLPDGGRWSGGRATSQTGAELGLVLDRLREATRLVRGEISPPHKRQRYALDRESLYEFVCTPKGRAIFGDRVLREHEGSDIVYRSVDENGAAHELLRRPARPGEAQALAREA